MSISKLKKITIYGLFEEKGKTLSALQNLGCIHLISLRESLKKSNETLPDKSENAFKALKFLLACPSKRHQLIKASGKAIKESILFALKNTPFCHQ